MKVRIRSNSNNIEICLVRTEKGAGIVKASPRTDHATGDLLSNQLLKLVEIFLM